MRATQSEWEKIVAAAHARGLMVPVEVGDVFKDSSGNPVLNGAGGVRKLKKVGGETKELQRFISNLTNMFQERIDGDDRLLPYLGQLTLLEQGGSEIILVDSEDFTSWWMQNLWRSPGPPSLPGDGGPTHGVAVVGGSDPVHRPHPGLFRGRSAARDGDRPSRSPGMMISRSSTWIPLTSCAV